MALNEVPAREVDLLVIGAGVAGLGAATVAAQHGLSVLVIERMGAGGQVMTVENVANHPAYPDGIAGYELGPVLQEQAAQAGADFMLDTVERVEPRAGGRHLVVCSGESIAARAVVVAAGSSRRKLHVAGEEALEGRGVSHCASCDGPLFRGDAVCVAGGGDSAVGEAVILAQHAAQVTLVFPEPAPHAQPYLMEALADKTNIALIPRSRIAGIDGTDSVTGVQVEGPDGLAQSLPVQGVFVYAGLHPNTGFLHGALRLDAQARIETDDRLCSSEPGIYAAGDIRAGARHLLVNAAQDGEQAARAAIEYIKGDKK